MATPESTDVSPYIPGRAERSNSPSTSGGNRPNGATLYGPARAPYRSGLAASSIAPIRKHSSGSVRSYTPVPEPPRFTPPNNRYEKPKTGPPPGTPTGPRNMGIMGLSNVPTGPKNMGAAAIAPQFSYTRAANRGFASAPENRYHGRNGATPLIPELSIDYSLQPNSIGGLATSRWAPQQSSPPSFDQVQPSRSIQGKPDALALGAASDVSAKEVQKPDPLIHSQIAMSPAGVSLVTDPSATGNEGITSQSDTDGSFSSNPQFTASLETSENSSEHESVDVEVDECSDSLEVAKPEPSITSSASVTGSSVVASFPEHSNCQFPLNVEQHFRRGTTPSPSGQQAERQASHAACETPNETIDTFQGAAEIVAKGPDVENDQNENVQPAFHENQPPQQIFEHDDDEALEDDNEKLRKELDGERAEVAACRQDLMTERARGDNLELENAHLRQAQNKLDALEVDRNSILAIALKLQTEKTRARASVTRLQKQAEKAAKCADAQRRRAENSEADARQLKETIRMLTQKSLLSDPSDDNVGQSSPAVTSVQDPEDNAVMVSIPATPSSKSEQTSPYISKLRVFLLFFAAFIMLPGVVGATLCAFAHFQGGASWVHGGNVSPSICLDDTAAACVSLSPIFGTVHVMPTAISPAYPLPTPRPTSTSHKDALAYATSVSGRNSPYTPSQTPISNLDLPWVTVSEDPIEEDENEATPVHTRDAFFLSWKYASIGCSNFAKDGLKFVASAFAASPVIVGLKEYESSFSSKGAWGS